MAAQAQGTLRGAERGAQEGADAAGPIGGIVGGAVGAATGTIGGILGVEDRPRFRSYVRERNVRSYDYDGRVVSLVEHFDDPVATIHQHRTVVDHGVAGSTGHVVVVRDVVIRHAPVLVDGRHRIIEVLD
jgi:hypothetical protein